MRGRKYKVCKKVKCEKESKKSMRKSYFPPRSLLSFTLISMDRKYVKVRKRFVSPMPRLPKKCFTLIALPVHAGMLLFVTFRFSWDRVPAKQLNQLKSNLIS